MTHVQPGSAACVVVGVDGSKQSQQALQWAVHIAATLGAQIRVVAAWEYPATYGWALTAPWNPEDDLKTIVTDTIAATLGADRADNVTIIIQEGGAAHVLLAESADARMLIVGSRGHGGFAGLLLGSVSAAVTEHAACPVLVVHGDRPGWEV